MSYPLNYRSPGDPEPRPRRPAIFFPAVLYCLAHLVTEYAVGFVRLQRQLATAPKGYRAMKLQDDFTYDMFVEFGFAAVEGLAILSVLTAAAILITRLGPGGASTSRRWRATLLAVPLGAASSLLRWGLWAALRHRTNAYGDGTSFAVAVASAFLAAVLLALVQWRRTGDDGDAEARLT